MDSPREKPTLRPNLFNTMTDQEAHELLQPFEEMIEAVVVDGFENVKRALASGMLPYNSSSRTISNMVHDSVVDRMQNSCGDAFKLLPADRQVFVFRGSILIQFKRLNGAGKPQNVPTKAALKINASGQYALPGFGSYPLITIGYIIPQTLDRIDDVRVCHMRDGQIMWSYSIATDSDGSLASFPYLTPLAPDSNAAKQPKRIKPKIDPESDHGHSAAG